MIDRLPNMIRNRDLLEYGRETIGTEKLISLINNISGKQTILDYGIGEGIFIKDFIDLQKSGVIKEGIKVFGVDKYSHILKGRNSFTALFGTMPIASESIGLALGIFSLGYYAENLEQLVGDFTELNRILSKDGQALLILDKNPKDYNPELFHYYKSSFSFPETELYKSGNYQVEQMSNEQLWIANMNDIWKQTGLELISKKISPYSFNMVVMLQKK